MHTDSVESCIGINLHCGIDCRRRKWRCDREPHFVSRRRQHPRHRNGPTRRHLDHVSGNCWECQYADHGDVDRFVFRRQRDLCRNSKSAPCGTGRGFRVPEHHHQRTVRYRDNQSYGSGRSRWSRCGAFQFESSAASVPASVTVAQGASSATFPVTTGSVNATTSVTLTSTYAGVSKTAALTVNPIPAALSGVSISSGTIVSGQSGTGTVTLTGAAGSGGAIITLSSSNSSAASVPASVTVAARRKFSHLPGDHR